jgi:hypothetical protein
MVAAVATPDGVFVVDLEAEEIVDVETGTVEPEHVAIELPRVVAAARSGSTVVAVVDRRPPLVVSHDAGVTWHESGSGLPGGMAVAIAEDDPDLVVYGARNRLYVSADGGRFWRALALELPAIEAVELRS